MSTVYFIRHAKPNYDNHNDISRELTEQGLQDSKEIVNQLTGIHIDTFYSSPYKRATDTIKPLAQNRGKTIQIVNNFRERRITDHWIEDFNGFTEQQWSDFSYHLPGGESLGQVQTRNIQALEKVLSQHTDQTLVIGTHGTALATIINYYQPDFHLADFQRIKHRLPWLIKIEFQGKSCLSITDID